MNPRSFPNLSRRPAVAGAAVLALAAAVATAAGQQADSAVGVGSSLGNRESQATRNAQPRDAEWVKAKHTPTGQPFDFPFALPKPDAIKKTASGWEYSGQIEVGVIGGDADERSAQFRTYDDPDNGAHLNNFSLLLKQPKSAHFVEVKGGGAGRDDQYYGLNFGRYNDWQLKLYLSDTPHVFTDRYRSLWSGVGTGTLTLLPGLTPGGTASIPADNAAAVALTAADPGSTLSLKRRRAGARLDLTLSATWKAYVSYALEERRGARPFAAVWGNAGGTAPIEVAEPVNYDTEDILAGVMHVDTLSAFNLRLSASIFHNNVGTLTFQQPFRIPPAAGVTTVPAAGAFTQGRFDLAPSNRAFNARAEYTRKLPDFHRGYVSAVVSAGKWRQNDDLIPYTTIPGITQANVSLLPGGGWDTVGSLSRRSANTTIDTRLADLTLSVNPTQALNLKAKARYHELDNTSDPFLAVNPNAVYIDADATTAGNQTRGITFDGVTGVWGRVLNDASGQNLLLGTNANPAGNLPIKSPTYGSKQFRFGPMADYRINKESSVNAVLERETIERTQRERKDTWEDRAKVGYVNRGLRDSTVRVSYEYARRRGSAYKASTYDELFSSAIFPIPTTAGANVNSWAVRSNTGMRNFELSDRDQHTINARFDTMVRTDLNAGISFQTRETDYPGAAYGRTKQSGRSLNFDLSYNPTPQRAIYGFYSHQDGKYRQTTIPNANAAVTIGLVTPLGTVTPANAIEIGAAPGGPIFPLINTWTGRSDDRNHVVGAGVRQDWGKASLNVDYSHSIGRTRIAYDYTVGGAVNAANAPLAGTRMPDLATDIGYLDASLRIPINATWTARLQFRHQREEIRDWHYTGLATTQVVPGNNAAALPTATLLDGGPTDFRVQWYGVSVQMKF